LKVDSVLGLACFVVARNILHVLSSRKNMQTERMMAELIEETAVER
jgi:hypothetical protein